MVSREGANVEGLLEGVVVVIVLSREGAKVETFVGAQEGALVGPSVMASVGTAVAIRRIVGAKEGALVGSKVSHVLHVVRQA